MSVYLHGMQPAGVAAAGPWDRSMLMPTLYVDTLDETAGAPGSGKTALALGIAQELGTKVQWTCSGSAAMWRMVLHSVKQLQLVE